MAFFKRLLRFFRPDPHDRFLALARSIAAATPGIEVVSEDRERFTVILRVGSEGGELQFFLGNIFAECAGLPPAEAGAKLERALLGCVQSVGLGEVPRDFALEHLVPVVRALSNLHANPLAGRLVTRPLQPFVQEALVLDLPDVMQYLTIDQLGKWELPVAEAFRIARVRIAGTKDKIEPYSKAETATPLWHIANDDDYESSRLLVPGWLDAFADRVQGAPVVVVPDRRTVLVGGLDSEGHLARMLDIANEIYLASSRRVSPVPYTVDGMGGVRVLRLPDGHPLAKRVKAAGRTLASIEYAAQREDLDERHAKEGVELFVANYSVARQPDGEEFSLSYWAMGVDSLIPRAEKIALSIPDASHAKGFRARILTWDQLLAVAGACLAEDPTYQPVLYRTLRGLDAGELAAVEALFQ